MVIVVTLILIFILWVVILYLNTKVRSSKEGLFFGLRKYTKKDLQRYTFRVEKIIIRPRRHLKKKWFVKVEVYDGDKRIRTQMLHFYSEEKADTMVIKLKDALSDSKTK